MLAATLVGGGPLLASQAGASAVLVATLQPPEGFDFERAFDALVGSGTALAVGSLLLPVDPVRLVREGLGPVLDRLAAVLDAIADALEHRDAREAERALAAVGRVDALYDHLSATLAAAGDAARISLGRRDTLSKLDRYVAAVARSGWRSRTCARWRAARCGRSHSTTAPHPRSQPPSASSARPRASWAASSTRRATRSRPARPALHAVRLANAVLAETSNLSAVHIVGQVRLVAVDLLRAGGMPRAEAQQAVRGAAPEKLS